MADNIDKNIKNESKDIAKPIKLIKDDQKKPLGYVDAQTNIKALQTIEKAKNIIKEDKK